MPEVSFRNNFSSGVLDPLLEARSDIPQYRTGLRQGTNVMLLPHGGFMRRPGCRFCRELTGLGDEDYPGRLGVFRFNLEQQYVLHFRDERVDVYQPTSSAGFADAERITRIRTPYTDDLIPGINLNRGAQTADTRVICHQSVPPHRLLRAALRETDPIKTTVTSTVVRVYHPDHELLDEDEIGLSGLTDTGGIVASRLNTFHEVQTVEGDFGATDIATTATTALVDITMPAGHGFTTSDRITLSGLTGIGGYTASQLNRTHDVFSSGPTLIQVTMPLDAATTVTGGAGGHWKAASFYEIDVGGSTTGITSTSGGGTAGRAWVLHSLAPNDEREVALENLPQFDFRDGDSPEPSLEQQSFIFDNFSNGDSYKLSFSVPLRGAQGGTFIQPPFIDWTSEDIAENARRIEAAYELGAATATDVTLEVEYDEDGSSGDTHRFVFRFSPPINIDAVDIVKIRTVAGDDATITPDTEVEGGSTEEDVISTTRGWPSGCLFYQRRLWFYGLASRPSTILGSKIESFFDFETGSALDGDAIDATGEFDPVLHMIGERGLFLLTSGSEVEIAGGDGEAITPSNIKLTPTSRYGATTVAPVSVAGRPIYIDRTGRTVRQLGFSDVSASAESKDISVLSQNLISEPVSMDVWRNEYGDYAALVNDDGTMTVLNINVDQGVAGWTPWTTTGDFIDVCEAGDTLYAIIERNVDGVDVVYLEAFDFDYHTDSGAIALGLDLSTWSNIATHLEGETVQVRLDGRTMSEVVVESGDVETLNGDVPITGAICEVGLALPTPTAEPMPPQTGEFTSVIRAAVDRYESKAVFAAGYRLRDTLRGATVLNQSFTGISPIHLRGWGARKSVVLTFPEPQPATIRAVEMVVA